MKTRPFLGSLIGLVILLSVVVVGGAPGRHIEAHGSPGPPDIAPGTVLVKFPLGQGQPPVDITLRQLMDTFNVPGLSVAVIDNYQIAWASGFGVTERGGRTPVTATTLFQAGSISKPVAAVGAMALVEQGKLSLDEDVNKKLTTWKVPENEFTRDQKVTLRRLMSHSAGLTVHGFPGYAVNEPVPTLVQIFNGEKPANTKPIRVDFVPGTKMRYSGGRRDHRAAAHDGRYRHAVSAVHAADGAEQDRHDRQLVRAAIAVGACGAHRHRNAHGRHALSRGAGTSTPEMAAAGLWTTPTDLARFAIEIALSTQGKANHVLSQKSAQEMLTPQIAAEGGEGHVGLAFFLEEWWIVTAVTDDSPRPDR